MSFGFCFPESVTEWTLFTEILHMLSPSVVGMFTSIQTP